MVRSAGRRSAWGDEIGRYVAAITQRTTTIRRGGHTGRVVEGRYDDVRVSVYNGNWPRRSVC
jgi:hypothetical protein